MGSYSYRRYNKMSKCNCGKKATSEWIIIESTRSKTKTARTMKWCEACKPKQQTATLYEIHSISPTSHKSL